jgi:two-component sensor histidine kinase
MEVQKRRAELASSNIALAHAKVLSKDQNRQLILLLICLGATIIIALLLYRNAEHRGRAKRSIEMQHAQLVESSKRIQEESARNVTLLRELHHRVKNNLQIIYSLISLQKRRVTITESIKQLDAIQARIHAMALVHERLYAADDMEHVSVKQYITSLVEHMRQIYLMEDKPVHIAYDLDDVQLSLAKAIPVGLILNEAVSNAFKHAFVQCASGEIRITFHCDTQQCHLEIRDNGCNSTNIPDDKPHLGLKIIKSMSEQLQAQYEFLNQQGYTHSITFEIASNELEENSNS